jgi:hypothetical protein
MPDGSDSQNQPVVIKQSRGIHAWVGIATYLMSQYPSKAVISANVSSAVFICGGRSYRRRGLAPECYVNPSKPHVLFVLLYYRERGTSLVILFLETWLILSRLVFLYLTLISVRSAKLKTATKTRLIFMYFFVPH